jgi:SAM-dependent methyltransferase
MLSRHIYLFLKYQDYFFSLLSCRAMKWRRYSQHPVHPKHIFDDHRSAYLHGLFKNDIVFLDIGSGVGTDCLLAAKYGAAVAIGVEGNRDSLLAAVCRKQQQKAASVFFIQTNLEEGCLPFVDNFFDLVNFSNVLEHIINRQTVLAELKRVKKKDGLAVISVPNTDTAWKRKQAAAGLDSKDDPDHKIEYSRQSLFEEMQAAGLEICSDLMPVVPSWPWNGLIAMSAFFSPALYRKMQRMKRNYVEKYPDESIGWVFAAR